MRSMARVIDDAQEVSRRSDAWPWQVTERAAEAFRDRVDPSLSVHAAWRLLERCLPAAELLPQPTRRGQQRWRLPGAENVVAVCKPDPELRARVAVTVLGPNEYVDEEAITEDVLAAYQRATAPEAPISEERRVAIAPVRRAPGAASARPAPAPALPRPPVKTAAPGNGHGFWEHAYRGLEKRYDAAMLELQREREANAELRRALGMTGGGSDA